jgi:hypothetical protein
VFRGSRGARSAGRQVLEGNGTTGLQIDGLRSETVSLPKSKANDARLRSCWLTSRESVIVEGQHPSALAVVAETVLQANRLPGVTLKPELFDA